MFLFERKKILLLQNTLLCCVFICRKLKLNEMATEISSLICTIDFVVDNIASNNEAEMIENT